MSGLYIGPYRWYICTNNFRYFCHNIAFGICYICSDRYIWRSSRYLKHRAWGITIKELSSLAICINLNLWWKARLWYDEIHEEERWWLKVWETFETLVSWEKHHYNLLIFSLPNKLYNFLSYYEGSRILGERCKLWILCDCLLFCSLFFSILRS